MVVRALCEVGTLLDSSRAVVNNRIAASTINKARRLLRDGVKVRFLEALFVFVDATLRELAPPSQTYSLGGKIRRREFELFQRPSKSGESEV